MKAEITVTRTPGEIPHEITLSVELDADGTVSALLVETVYLRILKFDRHVLGYYEEETDEKIATVGKFFDLTEEEIEEAKKAIASNQAAFDAQESYMGHFPLAGIYPHEEEKKC